jgi:hypothetical protein
LHTVKDPSQDDQKTLTELVTNWQTDYSEEFAIDTLKQLSQIE